MNEIIEEGVTVTESPPKPKRKYRRKYASRLAKKAAPFKAPDEFAGMTAVRCPDACKPERCVISETNVCAHPMKSGLQPALMANPVVLARYNRAKKALAHQKIDLR